MHVRTLCLGILSFCDKSGYDIRKRAADGNFSHFCEASYGSIYPALAQLTEEDLVTFEVVALDGKPPRKVYSITQAGRDALFETLQNPPGPDRFKSEFLFYSLFADKLPSNEFRKLLIRKISETKEKLSGLRHAGEVCDHGPSSFALGYGIAMNEAVLEYLEGFLVKFDSHQGDGFFDQKNSDLNQTELSDAR